MFGIEVIARELTTAVQIRFNSARDNVVNSNSLDSIRDTDLCSPSVYHCNISSFQSWVTNHVYMTPISGRLAVFASKNKEVVQIRVQVLVWRQCLHGWSLQRSDSSYHFQIL